MTRKKHNSKFGKGKGKGRKMLTYTAVVNGIKKIAFISANTYSANHNTCLTLHAFDTGDLIDELTINIEQRMNDDQIAIIYDPLDEYNIKQVLIENNIVTHFSHPFSVGLFPELRLYAEENQFYMVAIGFLTYYFMEEIRTGTKAKILRNY